MIRTGIHEGGPDFLENCQAEQVNVLTQDPAELISLNNTCFNQAMLLQSNKRHTYVSKAYWRFSQISPPKIGFARVQSLSTEPLFSAIEDYTTPLAVGEFA